jgi:hypothetical protein
VDSSILPAITGSGGALVVLAIGCWLLVRGTLSPKSALEYRDKQIADLRDALALERQRADTERQRADAAILAAQTTNSVLAALHREVAHENPA